jgi:hypothetical protein
VEVAIKEKLDAEKSFIEYKLSSERSEFGFMRPNFASIGVWVNRAIFRCTGERREANLDFSQHEALQEVRWEPFNSKSDACC